MNVAAGASAMKGPTQGRGHQRATHLKERLFAEGVEERVEVNQRHLIDKILARYSSEFTLFRELIQNANDAGATEIEIIITAPDFKLPLQQDDSQVVAEEGAEDEEDKYASSSSATAASSIMNIFSFGWGSSSEYTSRAKRKREKRKRNKHKPTQKKVRDNHFGTCMMQEVEIRNNGRPFAGEDWKRIKSIAEGNPNSESCGMFGVGFYSVFSITEQPIVRSGDECLIFHWRGDMLVTTKAKVEQTPDNKEGDIQQEGEGGAIPVERPTQLHKEWVSFVLEAREEMPYDLDSLCRFLVKSVTFTTNVRRVRLFVNEEELLVVNTNTTAEKNNNDQSTSALDAPEKIEVPRFSRKDIVSRQEAGLGYMTISDLTVQDLVVEINRFGEPLKIVKMKQVSSQIAVHWDLVPSFLENMKRILKKTPPSKTNILLVYNSHTDDEKTSVAHGQEDSGGEALQHSSSDEEGEDDSSFFSFFRGSNSSSNDSQLYRPSDEPTKSILDEITSDLYPAPKNGHVFIGFSTHQTTGTGYHLTAQLIPTVERENIDFQDVYISNWNCNLLLMAGQVSRLYFDYAMKQLQAKQQLHKEDPIIMQQIENEVSDLLAAHSFYSSNPHTNVARLLYQYFYVSPTSHQGGNEGMLVPSSDGIRPCDQVRLPYLGMEFLLSIGAQQGGKPEFSVVPQDLFLKCTTFFQQLQSFKLIRSVALHDLFEHLKTKELSLDDLLRLFKWYSSGPVQQNLFGKNQPDATKRFLLALNAKVPRTADDPRRTEKEKEKEGEGDFVCQNLGTIVYFVTSKGMKHLPLPSTTIYHGISDHCAKNLMKDNFKWKELTFWDWWMYMKNAKAPTTTSSTDESLQTSGGRRSRRVTREEPQISMLEKLLCSEEHVIELFRYISQLFPSMQESQRVEIVSFLKTIPCMPVAPPEASEPQTEGQAVTPPAFKRPPDTYFPQVKLFKDISHVRPDVMNAVSNKNFLKALGVRENVDLRLVLERLELLRWDVKDLLAFLVKEQPSFSSSDWNLLKNASFLPGVIYKDTGITIASRSGGEEPKKQWVAEKLDSVKKAGELFFPHDAVKSLGLPVLDWPDEGGKAQLETRSKQAMLLRKIGMADRPTMSALLKIASASVSTRDKVLAYMQDNIEELLKNDPTFNVQAVKTPFIPVMEQGAEFVALPKDCYINESPFGFPHVAKKWENLAKRLGIALHPPLKIVLDMVLAKPPDSYERTVTVFEYFFTRLNEFRTTHWEVLQKNPFIPVFGTTPTPTNRKEERRKGEEAYNKGNIIRYAMVSEVLIRPKATSWEAVLYDNIFDYADFGENANVFLKNCGVKEDPTPEQLAFAITRNYLRYLSANGVHQYLGLLFAFSTVFSRLPSNYMKTLAETPFCLAYIFEEKEGDNKEVIKDDESITNRKDIAVTRKASECYLIDNERYLQLFNPARVPDLPKARNEENEGSGPTSAPPSALEAMYEALGSKWITQDVKQKCVPQGKANPSSEKAQRLKERLVERKALLLHNMQGKRRPNSLKDAEKVIDSLTVYSVDQIQRVLTFGPKKKVERANVSIARDPSNPKVVNVYITEAGEGIDYFDVGTELVSLLYSKSQHDDALLAAMLLQTPLPTLRRKGWPVDRLLQQKFASPSAPDSTQFGAGKQQQQQQQQQGAPKQQEGKHKQQRQQAPEGSTAKTQSKQKAPHKGDTTPPTSPEPQSFWTKMINTVLGEPPAPLEKAPPPPPPDIESARKEFGKTGGDTVEVSRNTIKDTPVSGEEHKNAMDMELRRALGSMAVSGGPMVLHQEQGKQETVHYSCEELPEQLLELIAKVHGISVYLQEGTSLTLAHEEAMEEFADLLTEIAGIFSIPLQSINIFLDFNGRRIAFNRGCTLYFNLRMFLDLHYQRIGWEAYIFWYLTACHELAHNNVSPHNEAHESLMSWFAYKYMGALMQRVLSKGYTPALENKPTEREKES